MRLAMAAFAVLAAFIAPVQALSTTVTPPAPTPPPNHTATYTYKTFLDPASVGYFQIHKFHVDFGTLTLTFKPNKSIRGVYNPDFSNRTTVTGRLTGAGKFWLQIGSRRFAGWFTPRGFAAATPASPGSGWRLWGQFLHA